MEKLCAVPANFFGEDRKGKRLHKSYEEYRKVRNEKEVRYKKLLSHRGWKDSVICPHCDGSCEIYEDGRQPRKWRCKTPRCKQFVSMTVMTKLHKCKLDDCQLLSLAFLVANKPDAGKKQAMIITGASKKVERPRLLLKSLLNENIVKEAKRVTSSYVAPRNAAVRLIKRGFEIDKKRLEKYREKKQPKLR